MEKKNRVLFTVEYYGGDTPCVYWGERVPSIDEAKDFLRKIGHTQVNYGTIDELDDITDVYEIDIERNDVEGLWDMSIEYPHFCV